MTLVARFNVGNIPVMLADVLVSTDGEVPDTLNIPASAAINKNFPDDHKLRIHSLVQKINVLSDRLIVAFSGDGDQAKDVAEVLSGIAHSIILDEELVLSTLDNIEVERKDKLQIIGVLTTPDSDDPNGFQYRFFGNGVKKTYLGPSFGKMGVVAGSGIEDFLEVLQAFSPNVGMLVSASENSFIQAELLSAALACQFTGYEFSTGKNLMASWGGGIELLVPWAGKFKKLDHIVHLFWKVVSDRKGRHRLVLEPRFVKNQYWDDTLLIRVVELADRNGGQLLRDEVHLVPPVLKDVADYDFSELPEMNFDSKTLCNYVELRHEDGSIDCLSMVRHSLDDLDEFRYVKEEQFARLSVRNEVVDEIAKQIFDRSGIRVEFD